MKKNILSFATLFVFVILFIFYFIKHLEEFKFLLDLNHSMLYVIALGHLATIFANGWFTKIILKPFNMHIPQKESFFVSLITTIGNYFTPFRGGAGIRAIYLKKHYNLSYKDYMSSLSGNYVIVFLLNSLAGIVATLYLKSEASASNFTPVLGTLILIFVSSLFLATLGMPKLFFIKKINLGFLARFLSILESIADSWNMIIKNKRLVWKLFLLTFINLILVIIITKAATIALGISLEFWQIVLYSSLGSLSLLLSITPGAIGIKESIYIFSSLVIGLNTEQILALAIVDRGVLFVVLFSAWTFVPWLKKRVLDKNSNV